MAELVICMGSTGSGKSYGIKSLDPKETVVINLNKSKRLPWRGSSDQYDLSKKNFFNVDEAGEIINLLKNIDTKAPQVKCVVIDDMRYLMEKEYLKKALEGGWQRVCPNQSNCLETPKSLIHSLCQQWVQYSKRDKDWAISSQAAFNTGRRFNDYPCCGEYLHNMYAGKRLDKYLVYEK